jgi:hypothetical protein
MLHSNRSRSPYEDGTEPMTVHRGDLGGGAAGLLPLELNRQLQHARIHAGPADPWVGQQGLEPADPPGGDPAVQGVAADPHAFTGRAEVVPVGQRADQPAALTGAKRGVGGLPDEGVAEQRDGLAAVVGRRHGGSLPVSVARLVLEPG